MTDDLVKRLLRIGERIAVPCPDGIKGCLVFHFRIDTDPTCKEAADRIEKLEAALRQIKELHHGPENEDVSIIDSIFMRDDRTYKIVCDTLEGKEDE